MHVVEEIKKESTQKEILNERETVPTRNRRHVSRDEKFLGGREGRSRGSGFANSSTEGAVREEERFRGKKEARGTGSSQLI